MLTVTIQRDWRAMQAKGAATKRANTPKRRIDAKIMEIAASAPELTDEQYDKLAAIIRRRPVRSGAE